MRNAIAALILALSGPAMARENGPLSYADTLLSSSYGVFCDIENVGTTEAPGTASGTIGLYATIPQFLWNTNVLPAYPGLSFGVRSEILSTEDISPVTIRLTHPPLRNSGVTEQVYITVFQAGGVGFNAYTFDTPEELVTGEWVFEATADDVVLYRMTFTVVDPAQMPQLAGVCSDAMIS